MLAVETRRLLAPSLAPRLTRPGILNTTWKPLTSAVACCSSARSIDGLRHLGRRSRRRTQHVLLLSIAPLADA